MAEFPNLTASLETGIRPDWGLDPIVMDDGTLRRQNLFADPQYLVTIVYPALDDTEKASLEAWLVTNIGEENTITIREYQYTVGILSVDDEQLLATPYYRVIVSARGTRVAV